jgi:hypothetical protein
VSLLAVEKRTIPERAAQSRKLLEVAISEPRKLTLI